MKTLAREKPLVVSVVAGKTIAALKAHFGQDVPVIRTIPNTPSAVGRGITAIAPGNDVSDAQVELATALLTAIGEVVTVDDALDNIKGQIVSIGAHGLERYKKKKINK